MCQLGGCLPGQRKGLALVRKFERRELQRLIETADGPAEVVAQARGQGFRQSQCLGVRGHGMLR